MEFYFIRHGHNPSPSPADPDPDLSEKGIRQAHHLGERLRHLAIERLYASDMRRALHTAQVLQQHLAIPLETRPGLREIDMGRLRDATWAELESELPGYHAEWSRHTTDLPYPGGEHGADVAARALPVIEDIRALGIQRVALVTHGGVIRVLLCAFLGISYEKRFLFGAPLENCSVTVVRWKPDEGRYFLHSFNEDSYRDE